MKNSLLYGVSRTKKITLLAIFIALITIGAFIRIPLPITTFSLQIVFTTLSGLLLGSVYGGLSVLLYIVLGLIGVPIFTAGGGFGYVMQPTFGYLIAFMIGAFVAGLIVERSKTKSYLVYIVASLINMVIVFAIGIFYSYMITTYYLGQSMTIKSILVGVIAGLMVPDIFLCTITALLAKKLSPFVNKGSVIYEDKILNFEDEDNNMSDIEFLNDLEKKIEVKEDFSKEDFEKLKDIDLDLLCDFSNKIREKYCSNKFYMCAIINAKSGNCSEDCKFCSQSTCSKALIDKYKYLDNNVILDNAKKCEKQGIKNFSIVTSGRKISQNDFLKVKDSIKSIKENTNLNVCVSLGLLEYNELVELKNLGVENCHNNLESSKENFKNICTTHTFMDKVNTIKSAIDSGINVCSGGIFGIGESYADRISMALSLKELNVKSIPLNYYINIDGNAISNNSLSYDEFVRMVAIYRLVLPNAVIRLAGGRAYMIDKGRKAFLSGANGAIIGDMLTTNGVDVNSDIDMIKSLGFDIV